MCRSLGSICCAAMYWAIQTHAGGNRNYLVNLQTKCLVEIIDSVKDKAQVGELACPSEEFDALADEAVRCLRSRPAIQDIDGRLVLGNVTGAGEQSSDPRAADLVLF